MIKLDLTKWTDKRTLDLNPRDYKSERPKQREPFWGSDWQGALAWLIGFVAMMSAVHYFR